MHTVVFSNTFVILLISNIILFLVHLCRCTWKWRPKEGKSSDFPAICHGHLLIPHPIEYMASFVQISATDRVKQGESSVHPKHATENPSFLTRTSFFFLFSLLGPNSVDLSSSHFFSTLNCSSPLFPSPSCLLLLSHRIMSFIPVGCLFLLKFQLVNPLCITGNKGSQLFFSFNAVSSERVVYFWLIVVSEVIYFQWTVWLSVVGRMKCAKSFSSLLSNKLHQIVSYLIEFRWILL